jgi:hypothetical protein
MKYDIFIIDDPHRHYTDHDIMWMLRDVFRYDDSRARHTAHYVIKEGRFCIYTTKSFEEAEHYASIVANANAWGYHVVILKGEEVIREWRIGPCSINYPDCHEPIVFMSDITKTPDMSRLFYCKTHGEWMMSQDSRIVLVRAEPAMPCPKRLRS